MDRKFGRMQPIELREYWTDEARDFTPWLASRGNLELLANELGLDLELEGVEVPVGPYRADIVAQDTSSNARVVIENQLEPTNHDHLGKAITYASGLDATVIIWVAKEIAEEHRRAVDFLNENASPNLRLFAVEMQLWRIGDSPAAPQFRVVSRPNDYAAAVRTQEQALSATKVLYLEFWEGFRAHLKSANTTLRLRKARPQHWFSIAIGRSKFSLNLTVSVQKQRLSCEIYIRGADAKRAYGELESQRPAIEESLGDLDWQELPEGQDCRIARYQYDLDVSDRSTWDSAFRWLGSEAERFHRVFLPRIRALPIVDTSGLDLDSLDDNETAEAQSPRTAP